MTRGRTLPTELLQLIFSEAASSDLTQLMSFASVCREWHDCIAGEPSFWCYVDAYYCTAPQLHLQLARTAKAPLRVRIDNSYADKNNSDRPELFMPIIFHDAYIMRITSLMVHVNYSGYTYEPQFSHWEALADGRDWPALKELRVAVYNTIGVPTPFQLNIRAPLIAEIWLHQISVRDWKYLGVGLATRVVEFNDGGALAPDSFADLYDTLPLLLNLTKLNLSSTLGPVTLHAVTRAARALDKITYIYLSLVKATVQEIEAVIQLNPHLSQLELRVQDEITGPRVATRPSDQRGARRNKLKELSISHNMYDHSSRSSARETIAGLIEDIVDLSSLQKLSLTRVVIRQGSPLPSRCTMLAYLLLGAVTLSPAFFMDLQLCQNLEILLIEAMWDPDALAGDAPSALDNLTPLPRLYIASLSSCSVDRDIGGSSAAAYGNTAFIRLARNASQAVTATADILNSVADIQLLLPQMPAGSAQISLIPRPNWGISGPTLVDIRLEYSQTNIMDCQAVPPAAMMSREFVTRQESLPALFDAVNLWLDSASRLKSVNLHKGIADQVAVALRFARESFEDCEFRACHSSSRCSHKCIAGSPLPKHGDCSASLSTT